MTMAMQWGYYDSEDNPPLTQGFIYFDAITAYRRSYSGAVSKHPIDGGGLVSDHFTRDNPIITISAVISSVDISIGGINISDFDGNTPDNPRTYKSPVEIRSNDKSLVNFLPNVVGQFFTPTRPDVILAPQSVETLEKIRDLLISLFDENKVELVKLYEYQGSQLLDSPLENLVLTSLTFNETPETGEGLYCDMTFEQVSFVSTRTTQVPSGIRRSQVANELNNKTAGLENQGKKDSTPRGATLKESILYQGITPTEFQGGVN